MDIPRGETLFATSGCLVHNEFLTRYLRVTYLSSMKQYFIHIVPHTTEYQPRESIIECNKQNAQCVVVL